MSAVSTSSFMQILQNYEKVLGVQREVVVAVILSLTVIMF